MESLWYSILYNIISFADMARREEKASWDESGISCP
jgi:hypothetical protein